MLLIPYGIVENAVNPGALLVSMSSGKGTIILETPKVNKFQLVQAGFPLMEADAVAKLIHEIGRLMTEEQQRSVPLIEHKEQSNG